MLTLWPQKAPALVIGHRGAMGYAPENTLVSFEEAIRRGADLIELDVQLSADGEVVVMHDTSVDRTTDGDGLVRDLPWWKIKSFDAGVWFGPDYNGQFVPSLAETLRHFRNRRTSSNHAVSFVVELKTIKGSGGSLADAVVAVLARENYLDRAFVISFDAVALQEVRAATKQLPIGLLYSDESQERVDQAKRIGAHAIFPRKSCVSTRLVQQAHKAELAVATWTANTKIEMKRLLACGVDALTTNFPDRLRGVME